MALISRQPFVARSSRMNFRLAEQSKQIIEQAAAVAGQSVSDYAVNHLVQAAQKTLQASAITRLTERDRQLFLELMDADTSPNEALQTAADRYRKHHG